jgi:hypothetical protein
MSHESRARFGVEKTLRVPARYKSFNCDADFAARTCGINGQLLDELLDLGIPHEGVGSERRFDRLDLENLSADLRLPSSFWLTARRWAKSLRRALEIGDSQYEFIFKVACPSPGHSGACEFSISPYAEQDFMRDEAEAATYLLRATLKANTHELDGLIDPVIRESRKLHFHKLPPGLSRDIGFTKETDLAHCGPATRYLINVAADHGLVARPAVGIFTSVPFSIRHVWLEFFVANTWLQADPFFLDTLSKWGLIDVKDWPLSCSPLAAMFRLGSTSLMDAPMILHGSSMALWSIHTRRVRGT